MFIHYDNVSNEGSFWTLFIFFFNSEWKSLGSSFVIFVLNLFLLNVDIFFIQLFSFLLTFYCQRNVASLSYRLYYPIIVYFFNSFHDCGVIFEILQNIETIFGDDRESEIFQICRYLIFGKRRWWERKIYKFVESMNTIRDTGDIFTTFGLPE